MLRLAEGLVTAGEREPEAVSAGRLGAALLAGFAALSTVGVALGLAGALGWPALTLVGLAAIALSIGPARDYARWLGSLPDTLRGLAASRWLAVGAVAAALLFAFQVAVALAPPAATDELAYHLPQAELIADSGDLPANVGGHFLYGNMPKLVEVLYAEALVFSSTYAVAHLVHVALFGGVLLFVFGAVRRFFGPEAGLLSVLLLLLYDELTRNATLAYVDAATAGFEVAAVLSAAAWLVQRRRTDLAAAALFAGAAAGCKYSGAATLVFVALFGVGAAVAVARSTGSPGAGALLFGKLAGLAFAVCGYWYVKNLLEYGNPVYPFFLGHEGISEATYDSVLVAVRGFDSRGSPVSFVRFPEDYARLSEIPVFLGLYLFPAGLLVRTHRIFTGFLATYVVAYSAYWFFFASHNTRFVMSAASVALILCAVGLARAPWRAVLPLFAVLALAAAVHAVLRAPDLRTATWNELAVKTRPDEMRFLLSGTDEEAFLRDVFGCHYDALVHLRRTGEGGSLAVVPIDGPNHELDFYASVEVETLPEERAEQRRALSSGGFRFLLVRETESETGLVEPGAKPIWTREDCRLFDVRRLEG